MKEKITCFCAGLALLFLSSCHTQYQVASIDRTRILVDQRYENPRNANVQSFMKPYKQRVDSVMSPVVGYSEEFMWVKKPESNLSNLLSDILVWSGNMFNEQPDFGVYNMGGIRASLSKGEVTVGNILDVAPFENKICFLSLTGKQVKELFSQIAFTGGQGVSKGVRLVISRDGKLISATINGRQVNENADYRIATLDYLAEGNDGLEAFRLKKNVVSPQNYESNIRFIINDYFRGKMKKGEKVSAKVEGRIKYED